jgi:cytochrome c peroxidase
VILRIGLGMVFVLFGADKFTHPERWIVFVEGGLIRWIQHAGVDGLAFLRLQGLGETLLGILYLAGAATRPASAMGIVLLAGIIVLLGFDPISIRDFGLLCAAACLLVTGAGSWSADAHLGRWMPFLRESAPMRKRILSTMPWALLAVCALAVGTVWLRQRGPRSAAEEPGVAVVASTSSIVAREPVQPLPDPELLDAARVALGDKLFHDPRLSHDNTVSCASCHDLGRGGADARAQSVGVGGRVGAVNSPTVFNARFNFKQFWDGRAENLLEQVDGPVENHKEMAANWPDVVAELQSDHDYAGRFQSAYPDGMTVDNLRDAIVTFEMSLVTPNSRFDRYLKGDRTAITSDEEAGYKLFKSVGCVVCHEGKLLGGNMFQTMGKMADYFADRGAVTEADYGRFNVTKSEDDRYKFKVPTLRNVALTAPYFHDGKAATLAEAVQVMSRYQLGLQLSSQEVDLMVKFLHTLTGEYQGRSL